MTPKDEPACCRCGRRFANELSWKIPVVIAAIILAAILQIALRAR